MEKKEDKNVPEKVWQTVSISLQPKLSDVLDLRVV